MRAYEYLIEDNRTKLEKLQDLINHPHTEETVRQVARSKMTLILDEEPQLALLRPMVETNIEADDFDRPFLPGITLRTLYEGLCGLSPGPNNIQFLRQGQIQMIVPPPFMGKTKNQYIGEVHAVCLGARNIEARMVEGHGYLVLISYI